MMSIRPILFSAPMVRALLDGRKTQTRRIVKDATKAPRFAVGDRLWVRETWTDLATQPHCDLVRLYGPRVIYRATDDDECSIPATWKPSIYMRRSDSRLTLIVTSVKVERLQDCSEDDAKAEGVSAIGADDGPVPDERSFVWAFSMLWDQINGHGAWSANPWVCAISFTVLRQNIDTMRIAA